MKTKTPKAQTKTARQPHSTHRESGASNRVRFELKNTLANEVFLAGDFNGWNPSVQRMEHNADGAWSAEIELPPGRHDYLFVADGAWLADPTSESVPNEFGRVNSVIFH